MIEYRSHAMRKRHSVNFRQTGRDSRVDSSTLTEETGSQNLPSSSRDQPRNVRKHAEARVTVPSHLTHVHMSEHTQWVQVVDMSLVICDSVVHRSKSGSDEFDSQQAHPKSRNRKFSSEATGKCSKFRFLENGMIRRNLLTPLPHGDLCGHQLQEQNFKT